jgi:hypothetical protein
VAKASKAEIINDAYSQMRISGLTVNPTPEDSAIALSRLEGMAAEFESRDICVGYNFTEEPDTGDESGIPLAYRQAYSTALAVRMVDFGKAVPPELAAQAVQSVSNLSAQTFKIRPTQYPHRQPLGSGNTLRTRQWQRYYQPAAQAPQDCDTNYMNVGGINDFSESWEHYLGENEAIDSYTRTVSDGLSIETEAVSTPFINYRVKALAAGYQVIEFTILTSDGRVNVRRVNFEVNNA